MTVSHQFRQARDRFVELLENPGSLEQEWEALFTDFPFILTECLSLGIAPAQLIPCKPGRAEADFYFYPRANDPLSRYGVIEIKRPQTRILSTPRKDVILLSPDAATALAQAQKYAIELGASITRTPAQSLVLGSPHHLFVIAGMSTEIERKVTTELHSMQFHRLLPLDCRLFTFDQVRESLESRTPPVVHVVLPWPTYMTSTLREAGGLRRFGFGPRRFFAATCVDCGQQTESPIRPVDGKPVYCRDCYPKRNPAY